MKMAVRVLSMKGLSHHSKFHHSRSVGIKKQVKTPAMKTVFWKSDKKEYGRSRESGSVNEAKRKARCTSDQDEAIVCKFGMLIKGT